MCRPVACKQCAKTTWAGCGLHVDQVMAGVPKDQQCPGHDGGSAAQDAPRKTTLTPGRGLLGWLSRNS